MDDGGYSPAIERFIEWAGAHSPGQAVDWTSLGLDASHVEELMRLIREAEAPIPLHALHALADVTGQDALRPLAAVLCNEGLDGPLRREAVGRLGLLARRHREARDDCVQALIIQLERFEENDVDLNTALVGQLVAFKASQAAVVVGRAYHAHRVDEFAHGPWEEVRHNLGLGPAPAAVVPKARPTAGGSAQQTSTDAAPPTRGHVSEKQRRHDRERRKQADKSRRRNRKKKR